MLKHDRLDCFVIWGHGITYLYDIISEVRNDACLEVVYIHKHTVKNIKKLVHQIYSFDYAPLFHLKSKIKYLESTGSAVYFIFINNRDPQEDFYGEGRFRHVESVRIKSLKEGIRAKFNPRGMNGEMTHEHIIHATDNESQTDSILKLLGYKQGVKKFIGTTKIVSTPHYIKEPDHFMIKSVTFDNLYCTNAISTNDGIDIITIPVHQSVQYKALFDLSLYSEYIGKFIGTIIKQDYNVDKYFALKDRFSYLSDDYSSSYVVVKKSPKKDCYIINDGLHRASIHLFQGNRDIIVCEY